MVVINPKSPYSWVYRYVAQLIKLALYANTSLVRPLSVNCY